MPDVDRSRAFLRLIADVAEAYYTKHGHYPAEVRVGSTVASYFLKPGDRDARIALRPGGTTVWITIVADIGLRPMEIVV